MFWCIHNQLLFINLWLSTVIIFFGFEGGESIDADRQTTQYDTAGYSTQYEASAMDEIVRGTTEKRKLRNYL